MLKMVPLLLLLSCAHGGMGDPGVNMALINQLNGMGNAVPAQSRTPSANQGGQCYGPKPMIQPFQRGCGYVCLGGQYQLYCP